MIATTTLTGLKESLIEANNRYRRGDIDELYSDEQYDAALEVLKQHMPEDEYDDFISTLFEPAGTCDHPFIMGSLHKIKHDDADALNAFIVKYVPSNNMHISAKIDGIACRIQYKHGKLVGAYTRGDGVKGQDITDKIMNVNCALQQINDASAELHIRGELVIYKSAFEKIADTFKNARNACAGIMNKKTVDAELVSTVTFVAYEIMGSKMSKREQFVYLKDTLGFTVPYHCMYIADYSKSTARIRDELRRIVNYEYLYDIDGLVLSDAEYTSENVQRPMGQVALKFNQLTANTAIIDIDWRGPSKMGKYVPVAKVEPVELGGSIISNVTCHNLDYIQRLGLKIGSKIELVKSGDIIPRIVHVIDTPKTARQIDLPTYCTECNSELTVDGCDLICDNINCASKEATAVANFIRKFDIENAASRSLIKWGIDTFDNLLAFRPDDSKSQTDFYQQLLDKVFTATETEIFANLNYNGLNSKSIHKLIMHYGYTLLRHYVKTDAVPFTYPVNIGQTLFEKFKQTAQTNFEITDKFTADTRWKPQQILPDTAHLIRSNRVSKGVVCFTGKYDSMTRKEAEKRAIEQNWEIGAVNADLNMLICADVASTSSKTRKARELGIQIVTYDEFFKNII